MIYARVLNRDGKGVFSPADRPDATLMSLAAETLKCKNRQAAPVS
jgi:hypothetical protein